LVSTSTPPPTPTPPSPPPSRGKALAVFLHMARGNLLQIEAAGEGYSKFSLRGRILREPLEKRRKKCELNL